MAIIPFKLLQISTHPIDTFMDWFYVLFKIATICWFVVTLTTFILLSFSISIYWLLKKLIHNKLLLSYCQDIALILFCHCQAFAKILLSFGQANAWLLPSYFHVIAKLFPSYCQVIAKLLPSCCQVYGKLLPLCCQFIANSLQV